MIFVAADAIGSGAPRAKTSRPIRGRLISSSAARRICSSSTQASRERVREPSRVLRLRLRRNGEQEPRFQVGEPCGHDEVIGGELEPQFARGLDESEILVGEFEDRNADEIDLLAARELQQQVERTFEAVEIDLERGLTGPAVGFEIILERGRASHPNRLSSSLEDHGARPPAPQADIRARPPLAPATSMRNGRLSNVEIIGL